MKNIKDKITINKVYALLFCAVVALLSVFSIKKLFNYYINDEMGYNAGVTDAETPFELDYITNFCGKMQFVNLNGAARSLLHESEMNGVIKLNNGYLAMPMDSIPEEQLYQRAEQISYFQMQLAEYDIPLLYVMTPYVIAKYDPQLPAGETEYGNQNMDIFLADLEELGVGYMDLREEIYLDGINQYDLWYKTDHHWTTEGGFYAYTKIENRLEGLLGVEVDPEVKDINHYSITTYKNWHLGSNGQRTGRYYAGVDDFDVILPEFDTRIQTVSGDVGTFEDIIINYEALQNKNYESRYTYDNVLGNALGSYVNLNADNDKKILVICDSMGKSVNPYLILSFSSIYTVDAYAPYELTRGVIESYQPDVVVIINYPTLLENPDAFSFGL